MSAMDVQRASLYEYAPEVVTRDVRKALETRQLKQSLQGIRQLSQERLVQKLFEQISQKIVLAFKSDSKIMDGCAAEGKTVEDLKDYYNCRVLKSVEKALERCADQAKTPSFLSSCVIS